MRRGWKNERNGKGMWMKEERERQSTEGIKEQKIEKIMIASEV
jgi:hypothetical protein